MHLPHVSSQELLLGASRLLPLVAGRRRKCSLIVIDIRCVELMHSCTQISLSRANESFPDSTNVLQRKERGRRAELSHRRVQQPDGALQLQPLVQRHDAGLGPVVPEQDAPQNAVVELLEPDRKAIRGRLIASGSK